MADIKAKDISVAQSIASSDLILGSSIAGTTANVKVDTLGKYIIDTLPVASLENVPVSELINDIKSNQIVTSDIFTVLGKRMFAYKCGKLVLLASPDSMEMAFPASTETYIFTLPEKYRPAYRVYVYFGNLVFQTPDKFIQIRSEGNMYFFSRTAVSANPTNAAFYAAYFTN